MLTDEKARAHDEELFTIQRLVTAWDVAEILGISPKTVHKLARDTKKFRCL